MDFRVLLEKSELDHVPEGMCELEQRNVGKKVLGRRSLLERLGLVQEFTRPRVWNFCLEPVIGGLGIYTRTF